MVLPLIIAGATGIVGTLLGSKKSASAGMSGGSAVTGGFIEVGTKKDVMNTSTQTTNSPQNTYAPQSNYTNTPTWTYAPTYAFNSTGTTGSNTTGAGVYTPQSVIPSLSVIPTTTQGSGTAPEQSTLSNLTDNVSTLAIIGAIGLGVFLLVRKKKWYNMINDTIIPKVYVGDEKTINVTGNTISFTGLKYENFFDATEEDKTGTSPRWNDTTKTFTITHPANSVLLGIFFQAEFKGDDASNNGARIKISGSTLGDLYTQGQSATYTKEGLYLGTGGTAYTDSFLAGGSSTYVVHRNSVVFNQNLPDTSTTFLVQAYNAAGHIYIKNVYVKLLIAYPTTL